MQSAWSALRSEGWLRPGSWASDVVFLRRGSQRVEFSKSESRSSVGPCR